MPRTVGPRRDSKHRVLHTGESIRRDGKYQFKYMVNGKPKFLYSWRLTPTNPQPAGSHESLLAEALRLVQHRMARYCRTDANLKV